MTKPPAALLLCCVLLAAAACDSSAIRITSPPDGAHFAACEEITFQGYAAAAPDGVLRGSALVWSSDADGLLHEGGAFTAQSLSPGAHVITLTATGSSGARLTAAVTITVEDQGGAGMFSGIAVDPYITGATFYEDRNHNGQCDAGEQESSATGDDGRFSFPGPVSACSTIRMREKGSHIGLPYPGEIKARAGTGRDDEPRVLSPLTTLLANGWTRGQLVTVLRLAGVWGVMQHSLEGNPMEGLEGVDVRRLTDGSFALARGAITVGAALQLIDGIVRLNPLEGVAASGYDITYTQLVEADELLGLFLHVGRVLASVVSYEQIRGAVENIGAGALGCLLEGAGLPPVVTAEIFIQSAVVIGNFLIDKLSQDVTYTPAEYRIGDWVLDLANSFFVMKYPDHACIRHLIETGLLPDVAGCTACVIDPETEQVACF